VGDPHLQKFDGSRFDSHAEGWKTLYAKDQLVIQLEQAKWNTRVAINRAVRYSTDGGSTWDDTLVNGRSTTKVFDSPDVKLTVTSTDYSRFAWATIKHIYHVYVTTSEYAGARGQCSQGKLRGRRLNAGDTSDGVAFPSGDEVKVSKEQAEEACADLREQRQNCVTDMRMVNEPDAIAKIKGDFDAVESTVKALEATALVSSDVKRVWRKTGSNVECDTNAGESYLKTSPGRGSTLEQCKKACEDSAACQSITYFRSGWCSHFSTPCSKTKRNKRAVAAYQWTGESQQATPLHWFGMCSCVASVKSSIREHCTTP